MIAAQSAVLAFFLAGPNMELVGAAVDMLANGDDPYVLEGVAFKSDEARKRVPDLDGCLPSVGSGSTREFVRIDFRCENDDGKFSHRATFSESSEGLLNIYVDPLPIAIGPTANALAESKLPSGKTQVSRLIRAIDKDDDPSLGGLIPLTKQQIGALSKLEDCDWISPRQMNRSKWFSIVTCDFHQSRQAQMVEVEFDDEKRALAVRVINGSKSQKSF